MSNDTMSRRRHAGGAMLAALCLACGADSPVEPGTHQTLTPLSPTSQMATVATAVEAPPTVRVTDPQGRPRAGVAVRFEVSSGELAAREAVTDADGVASVGRWVLGRRSGTQMLKVTAAGHLTLFYAAARPGAPDALTAVLVLEQVGMVQEVVRGPAVTLSDRFGNGIEDAEVVFEVVAGDGRLGSVARAVSATGTHGRAEAGSWTLGSRPGENVIIASVAGLEPMRFTALGLDSAAVVWYELTSKRTTWGGVRPPSNEYDMTQDRIAVSRFDPCLCREQSGHFVERGDHRIVDWISWVHVLDGSGSYRIAPADQGVATATFEWVSGGPYLVARSNRAPARLEGDRLLIDVAEPEMGLPETWVYTRVTGAP